MADHIKSMIISGYISTDGKDWRNEDAKKLAADIAALVQLRGLEFVGSVTARMEGHSIIDVYRHGALEPSSAKVGNSPRADTHERGAVPVALAPVSPATSTAADVKGTAPHVCWNGTTTCERCRPRNKEHRHYHVHIDGLPDGVVKVTHDHWHVHAYGSDLTQHLFTHLDFGQGEKLSRNPVSHVKDLIAIEAADLEIMRRVTPMPEPMVDTEMDRPVIGLSPTEDERLLTEHAKTCKACQECVTCREGVIHTHIGAFANGLH